MLYHFHGIIMKTKVIYKCILYYYEILFIGILLLTCYIFYTQATSAFKFFHKSF